jgi:hypothetical protein
MTTEMVANWVVGLAENVGAESAQVEIDRTFATVGFLAEEAHS